MLPLLDYVRELMLSYKNLYDNGGFMKKSEKYSICGICSTTESDKLNKGRFVDNIFRCYNCHKKYEKEKYADYYKNYYAEYYQKNKEARDAANRAYQHSPKGAYARLTYRAKRDLKDNRHLTYEQFLEIISKPCHYCGKDAKLGIDRANNSIGYVYDNSLSCCFPCNRIKRDLLSKEQMEVVIRAVLIYNETGFKLPKLNFPLNQLPRTGRDRSNFRYWYLVNRPNQKHDLSISEEEYYQFMKDNNNKCSYCTAELPTDSYCLDQIDSGKGYNLSNVRTACSYCNELKLDHLTADETEAAVHALQHHCIENNYHIWFKRKKQTFSKETMEKWESLRKESFEKMKFYIANNGWKCMSSFEEYDKTERNGKRSAIIECLKCGHQIGLDCSNYKTDLKDCQACIDISLGKRVRDGKYESKDIARKIGAGWEYISGTWDNGKHSIITAKCCKGHISSKEFIMYEDNNCVACANEKNLQKMLAKNANENKHSKTQRRNAMIKAYNIIKNIYKNDVLISLDDFLERSLPMKSPPCYARVEVKIDGKVKCTYTAKLTKDQK